MRGVGAVLLMLGLVAAAPRTPQMDSQEVLARYLAALSKTPQAHTVVFEYSISQAGPHVIEQRHRVYRSGAVQRDEITYVDGQAIKPPNIRIIRHEDRYSVHRLAPRPQTYFFLFAGTSKTGKHLTYSYRTVPLRASVFAVVSVSIDGLTFLPAAIHFKTRGGMAAGSGVVMYAKSDRYWMPVLASVSAKIRGHPAQERIVWSSYRFPKNLPASTFRQPRPLPSPSVAPFL
jgi:hypothetical protein